MSLFHKLKAFVQSEGLISGEGPTLLAVSGGVDSVVMAHLFRETGYRFGVVHCNFQLRGAESDGDEIFVKDLAALWRVPFFIKRFDTNTYAEKNGLSIQMAARELRYAWFREVACEHAYGRVATAHNLNDSIETALLNFVRGTGLSGLKGIAAHSSLNLSNDGRGNAAFIAPNIAPSASEEAPGVSLIRPLLFATRADIEAFARDNNIAWREDSSNSAADYSRNFLRLRVVPLLEELNPDFLHTASRNLARLRETEENLHFLLRRFMGEDTEVQNRYSIDKQKLAQLPAPRRALRELLKEFGFTEEQARQVAVNFDRTGLELDSTTGWRLLNDRNQILLALPSPVDVSVSPVATIQADDLMVAVPGGNRLVLMQAERPHTFPDTQEAIIVDAAKLRFPLILRPWQPGDAFQPFGMGGHSQKLQDFFTNLKISRFDKEKIRVLENGDGAIIWIPGYRSDERFKVTPETKQFLKIAYM